MLVHKLIHVYLYIIHNIKLVGDSTSVFKFAKYRKKSLSSFNASCISVKISWLKEQLF